MMIRRTDDFENKYLGFTNNRFLRSILRHPLGGLATHWVFQGLLYMDRTEMWFKLGLDVVLTLGGYWLARGFLNRFWALTVALLLAHTLNFLFNGQIWVVMKQYGLASNPYEKFEVFSTQLAKTLTPENGVEKLLVYGSLARDSWRESSDLDVRVIRKPGCWNGFWVCGLVMKERTRALFSSFPLDIYVLDSERQLSKIREDEEAIDLFE